MTRSQLFMSYADHAWLSRVYKKLTIAEQATALSFIAEHDHLDRGGFEIAVNRMFINQKQPTRHWKEILELLTCANSASAR